MVDGFVHQSEGALEISSQTIGTARGTKVAMWFPPLGEDNAAGIKGPPLGRALVVDDNPKHPNT
ncbi:MAG: hypothetical protein JXR15_16375 [Shimia sp.]|uniref:hypothetical protein n=1 Tax=Shimia sp. TaxID=1954381 RepID=UPI003B8B811A